MEDDDEEAITPDASEPMDFEEEDVNPRFVTPELEYPKSPVDSTYSYFRSVNYCITLKLQLLSIFTTSIIVRSYHAKCGYAKAMLCL